MELDSILYKVQGVLKNEERKGVLMKSCNKESEEKVNDIVNSLQNVLKNEELDSKAMRKLYILLFLNTDTKFYVNLKKHRKYAHLVGFFPQLSKYLFLKIAIALKLNGQVYESVKYFPLSLATEVLEICTGALEWLDIFVAVSFVENLLVSLFYIIHRSNDDSEYISGFNETFQLLLMHFDPDKGGTIRKIERLKKTEMKRYVGLVMSSLLSSLKDCTTIYSSKENDTPIPDFDEGIYSIEIESSKIKLETSSQAENSIVHQCYDRLISKCLSNVSSITVDLWMFWVEIGLDDIPDTENTLQKLIGESAFVCREVLKDAENFGISSKESDELVDKLNHFSIQPKSEQDLANALDLEQIVSNIKDPSKDTVRWLKFLISRPSFTFIEDSYALGVLKSKINLLASGDLLKCMGLLFEFIASKENCDPQKSITLEIVNELTIDSKVLVSKCFVEKCGLSEVLKADDFQEQFTKIFNKIVNDDEKTNELNGQFVSLAMQSPLLVVGRAVKEGITSEVRGRLIADLLGKLRPFCDAPSADGNTLLISALNQLLLKLPDLSESQHHQYSIFVRELVKHKILDAENYVAGCIMKIILQHMHSDNLIVLKATLETLEELLSTDWEAHCPACITMVMQVVEAVRWNPDTYKMAAVRVCEIALQLINMLVSKLGQMEVGDNQLRNLKILMTRLIRNPLNRYHLSSSLFEEPQPEDVGMRLIHRMHFGVGKWSVLQVQEDERNSIVYSLCNVLPVLTGHEWQELFCVLTPQSAEFVRLFHMAADALLIRLDSHRDASDKSPVLNCLHYAVLNLGNVVKSELTRWTNDDIDHRLNVLPKLCRVIDKLPQSYRDSTAMSFVKVLSQLLPEGSDSRPLTVDETDIVMAAIASVETHHVRQKLANTFLEIIHRSSEHL